jgi:hypothetical protein
MFMLSVLCGNMVCLGEWDCGIKEHEDMDTCIEFLMVLVCIGCVHQLCAVQHAPQHCDV